jgi:hypothetical protein
MGAIGIATMVVGLFLLSQLPPDAGYWTVVAFIIIQGFGVGIQMPVFTIAVQNAVPYKLLGVGTSNTNFFRGLGGSVGLSVLGSVMNARFSGYFMDILPEPARTSVQLESLKALVNNPQALVNAGAAQQLQVVAMQAGPEASHVADQLLSTLRNALCTAITEVFLISFAIVAAAMVMVFFLKEIPLRRQRLSDEELAEQSAGVNVEP